ncbi:VOC family protein [Saccharospirillum alexandrii]|uniref:VOC family protein n=1 Tax=Saccharospirillum alexandrii TaxID=2448477 RepID=UPI00373705DC
MMNMGAFSISLTVKDINASRDFYEKLGFTQFGGDIEHNYLIMKNGECLVGLFQGMFDKNILTFNPKWNSNAEFVEGAPDVRDIQRALQAKGIVLIEQADESSTGPAHITLEDPDGNPILIDQHV